MTTVLALSACTGSGRFRATAVCERLGGDYVGSTCEHHTTPEELATASLDQDGRPLPGVAQVAMQQGRYAARLIRRRITGQAALKPFRYFDKGTMAVVGKGFAVLHSGWVNLSGFLAWMAWAAVHLQFLAQSSLRVSVFVQWVWTYLTGQRGARLIVNHHGPGPSSAPRETDMHEATSKR